jgi:hypothetical protein
MQSDRSSPEREIKTLGGRNKFHIKALISVINRRKDNNCRSATSIPLIFSAFERTAPAYMRLIARDSIIAFLFNRPPVTAGAAL